MLSVLGATLCYSTMPTFLRHFLADPAQGGLGLDPWNVNALRYCTAALFWLPFVLVMLRRKRTVSTGVWRAAVVPALVNLAGQVMWGMVGKYASASVIGFVTKLAFLFTVVIGFVLFRDERVLSRTKWFWIGAGCCLLGLVGMSAGSLGTGSSTTAAGLVLLIFVTLFWGAYAVAVKRFMSAYPPILSFGVISLYTAAPLVPLMLIFGTPSEIGAMAASTWGLVVLSGLLGIAFAHVLYYRGILRLGAVVASGIPMISPFLTLLGATLVLGETIGTLETVGGIVIVMGGVGLVLARRAMDRGLKAVAGQ